MIKHLLGLCCLAAMPLSVWSAPTITDGGRSIQYPLPADVLQTSATVVGTNVSAVNLFVDTGSGFASSPMALDTGNVWKITIPGTGSLPNGTYVKYYYQATDDSGTATFPATAPTLFQVFRIDSGVPVGSADITINEILYDPTGSDNGGWSEFIELYNRRGTPIRLDYYTIGRNLSDISNVRLPENTEIPANGYLVLAGNGTSFAAKYGSLTPAPVDLGFVSSWIANSTGNVNITNINDVGVGSAKGTPFDQVPYTNSTPWPGGITEGTYGNPNNLGPSIELKNPAYDNSVGGNWKVSNNVTTVDPTRSRGTPNEQNSVYEAFSLSVTNVARNVQYPTTTSTITFSANVIGPDPITQVRLFGDVRDGNGFTVLANMTNTGGSTYEATVGPFLSTTTMKYYIRADDASTSASSPDNAPSNFSVVVIDDKPVGVADIVINEIMFDPQGNDNSAHSEWVELYNRRNENLNLEFFQFSPRSTGYQQVILPEGTSITANGYLVLAGVKSLFLTDYPDGSLPTNIDPSKVIDLEWATANIMQNGATGDNPNIRHANAIGYLGSANSPFDSVVYTGAAPWPAGLNNDGGATIELKDPALNNASAGNWEVSNPASAPNGTPLLLNSGAALSSVGNWTLY